MNTNTEFDGYVEQYSEHLTKLCCRLYGNYADAEDLFQETWLKALKYFDKYDSTRDFGKWLFAICINTYKNNCNSAFNKRNIIFSSTDEKDMFISSIPDRNVKNDNYEELIEIIKELPDKYRIVLAMRYFNDYSEKDVSEILEIPLGTVKSRLNKAKKLIKRRFSV